jgi:ABC-type branched-subunit amino acid transport system ATPase component
LVDRRAGIRGIEVTDLIVRYGGHVAADHVTLRAPAGCVTGLIGPNGAGKTTTFNACSGLLHPNGGSVLVNGSSVARLGPAARARRGIGRTFQRVELWDSMTVRENVWLGGEALLAGGSIRTQLMSRPGDHKRLTAMVDEAIALTGLGAAADLPVRELPTGQRRLVELARCLAGSFDLLLLDEPSSGLDTGETRRFGQVLLDVVAARETGIFLIEHDMSLVMDICEYIYVLDFGKLVFEGSPAAVASSDVVQAAYLGAAPAGMEQRSASSTVLP